MIDGRTQLVGLIGWPVEHSLSPVMHNAAFAALKMDWCYLPLPVSPQRVEAAISGLAASGFRGANVTIPHKRAIFSALSSLSPHAEALGAVNTLLIEQGDDPTIVGENTDVAGFLAALEGAGFAIAGTRVLVVGAGGAARAVAYALVENGAREVVILNRSIKRAQELIEQFSGKGQRTRLCAAALNGPNLISVSEDSDLLVNATPVGMWPNVGRSIWPSEIPIPSRFTVFDLVYNPQQTRLLEEARSAGARAISGLEMLIQQGARSFSLWTNRQAPIDVMREACVQRLASLVAFTQERSEKR